MKKLSAAIFAIVACTSMASAQWATTLEENLFTGENSPTMLGLIDQKSFIYVDCNDTGQTEIAYVEKVSENNNIAPGKTIEVGKLIIKADTGKAWEAPALMYHHNTTFVGLKHNDAKNARQIIKEIGTANIKIQLSMDILTSDGIYNSQLSAQGSTKAAKTFLANCAPE